jgi:hypothetical protein
MSRSRIHQLAGTISVLAFAALAFVAMLVLDTTAVLRLIFGWAWRAWERAPLETGVGVAAVITTALFLFGRRSAEAPGRRDRNPKSTTGKAAQRTSVRRSAGPARQKRASEKPGPEALGAKEGSVIRPANGTTRRKRVTTDA